MNKAAFKRKYLSLGFCLLLATFLSACQAPTQDTPGNTPTKVDATKKPPVDDSGSSDSNPQDSLDASSKVVLKTQASFPGTIEIDSQKIQKFEGGFTLPVYLQNVSLDEIVDTVSLQMTLPEGVRLGEVKTLSGFTAQIDGLGGSEPVIYFHPFSITADSYSPVVADKEPIFTLVFQGGPAGNIGLEGSFFQTSGTLIRTNKSVLQL